VDTNCESFVGAAAWLSQTSVSVTWRHSLGRLSVTQYISLLSTMEFMLTSQHNFSADITFAASQTIKNEILDEWNHYYTVS
jgi:hypothetical protein